MYFKKIYSCIFLIFAFIFANCIMFKGERTYSKNGVMVTYRSLNRFGSGIENYRIQHPIGISAKRVNNHLLNLFYRKIDPPGKAKPVFSSDQVDELSPLIVKAFKKVQPGKYLHFEHQSSKGMTSGDVFASAGKVHWRLLKINSVIYSNDPLRLRKPTWKLVRTRGQNFQKISTGISKKSLKNWILADFKLPKIKQPSLVPTNKKIPQKKIKDLELKQKLKTLKNLFNKGLIDQREYKKKKNEVINQYF